MLEKVLDFQKTAMFLTDTSEDIDAHSMFFFWSGHPYVGLAVDEQVLVLVGMLRYEIMVLADTDYRRLQK